MKKTILLLLLISSIHYCKAQSKDSTKQKQDTILVMSYSETIQLLNWIDSQHSDHQEIKSIESFIQKHIQIIPAVADKPKK